jgi:hypothetical protein
MLGCTSRHLRERPGLEAAHQETLCGPVSRGLHMLGKCFSTGVTPQPFRLYFVFKIGSP